MEAGALDAEERGRAAAADEAMAGADLGQRLETLGRDVSFSPPGCLVSFVGVERVLGAPFRVIDDFTRSGEADLEWLRARVDELSQEVMCLYAHLGLESADALARELIDGPSMFDTNVPEVHESQVQSIITSYCLAPILAHLARVLPPLVVRDHLQRLERLQVQVYDELTGCKMNGILC